MKTKQTGRKQKHFIDRLGNPIVGLSRRPSDGRWRIIGTQTTFSEPDETKAIEKFRRLTSQLSGAQQRMLERPNAFGPSQDEMLDWLAEQLRTRPKWVAEKTGIEQLAYQPLEGREHRRETWPLPRANPAWSMA
jgi:hypothetical protein